MPNGKFTISSPAPSLPTAKSREATYLLGTLAHVVLSDLRACGEHLAQAEVITFMMWSLSDMPRVSVERIECLVRCGFGTAVSLRIVRVTVVTSRLETFVVKDVSRLRGGRGELRSAG